jgi:hypothetical protein
MVGGLRDATSEMMYGGKEKKNGRDEEGRGTSFL